MWVEKTKTGKYKYTERYTDYMTGKIRRVSVTMEKNNMVIADCVSSSFAFAASNFETSYLSLILSESWRMVSLAAEISYRPCD